ncbi:hypothetical protein [Streptomyces microflavus]|uniref:hypothetical protein n=1 Tax=Streptomyces microflavus TaxID=1919 RepID=UPI003B20E0EE
MAREPETAFTDAVVAAEKLAARSCPTPNAPDKPPSPTSATAARRRPYAASSTSREHLPCPEVIQWW